MPGRHAGGLPFRDDARLHYVIPKVKIDKPGRPREPDGAVDLKNLDMNHCSLVEQGNREMVVYTAIVKAVPLKRKVKVVLGQYL